MKVVGRIGWLAVAGLDAAALVCLRPRWADLASDLAAPHRWVARVGADHAAITLGCAVLWCVALWLAFGCIAVLAAAVPGRVGRGGRYVARQMLPEAMLRAVAGAAGLSVLIAPIAADAGTVSNHASIGASALGGRLSHPAPDWPTDAGQQPRIRVGWPTDDPRGHRAHVPTPTLPSSATPSSGRSVPGVPPPSRSAPGRSVPGRSVPGRSVSQRSTSNPSAPDRSAPSRSKPRPTVSMPSPPTNAQASASPGQPHHARPGVTPTASRGEVLVKPGDCLWLIAAQRLGPDASSAEIAAAWPRWYATNERMIGADPSLVQPGAVLQVPPDHAPQGDAR